MGKLDYLKSPFGFDLTLPLREMSMLVALLLSSMDLLPYAFERI